MGALISAAVTGVATSSLPGRGVQAVRDRFETKPPRPPIEQVIVSEYVRQTRTATFWTKPPVMFPPSIIYFRRHFAEFDPRRVHRYHRTRFHLWVPQLVPVAPIFSGRPVEVLGEIASFNALQPVSETTAEWLIQLRAITVEDGGLVYCRVTLPAERRLEIGQYWTVRGLVLGWGPVNLSRGGFANVAYMGCSAMRRPRGELGRYLLSVERKGLDLRGLLRRVSKERQARLLRQAERALVPPGG